MAFSLALKGPVLLEYSKLQAHIIKYSSNNDSWENAKWIRVIAPIKAFMNVLSIRESQHIKKRVWHILCFHFLPLSLNTFLNGLQMDYKADVRCSCTPCDFSLPCDYLWGHSNTAPMLKPPPGGFWLGYLWAFWKDNPDKALKKCTTIALSPSHVTNTMNSKRPRAARNFLSSSTVYFGI